MQGFITNTAGGLVQVSSVARVSTSQLCAIPANGIVPQILVYVLCGHLKSCVLHVALLDLLI